MKKWITTSGCTIYLVTKGRSNTYLVLDDDTSVLIDTGLKNSQKELMKKLDPLLGERNLSYLILTHTHFDHTGNAAMIKENYKARIMVQESEANNLERGKTTIPQGTNPLTRLLVKIGRKIKYFNEYPHVEPDYLVGEKHLLTPKCYLIHTPGHSKGSMSLIVDNEVALVGDAMVGIFRWSVFPAFADDVPSMITSWEKLLKTGCNIFLPGHGTSNSRKLLEKQYKKYK
ncbi:MAG: Zn-dependent hydrolase, glyoxylase [Methanobacterium sp. Maddingley MBC34]|nr:MAG: Zn-dependent hydrolase, glyoxylase [Methanobacterium sp. Maddingley MBC34]